MSESVSQSVSKWNAVWGGSAHVCFQSSGSGCSVDGERVRFYVFMSRYDVKSFKLLSGQASVCE